MARGDTLTDRHEEDEKAALARADATEDVDFDIIVTERVWTGDAPPPAG